MQTQNQVSEFSEYSICKKCDWNHVPPSPPKTKFDSENNRLIRTCLNCGYQWDEMPADADPPPEPQKAPAKKPRSRWKQIEIKK